MPSHSPVITGIETLRQKSSDYSIEETVLDFLNIWAHIHHEAKNYDLADALTFSKSLLDSHIYPFFETHKKEGYLSLNKAWLKSFSSIVINWQNRGSILFPLYLVTYEICYHRKNLIDIYVNKILTKETQPTQENLFEFLFPILTNFPVPLSVIDISILKAYQGFAKNSSPLKNFNVIQSSFAEDFDVSLRTLQRRMSVIRLMQLVQSDFMLDMGRLGYETTLFIHQDSFPKEIEKYLLLSTDLTMATFSLTQIPYNKTDVIISLQNKMTNSVSQTMTYRTSSWNLTGLVPGEDHWQSTPPLLHGDPTVKFISPSPDCLQSLEPTFKSFRPLTPADIKILDFLTIQGSFRSLKDLSKTIGVSVSQISKRLDEYEAERLLLKTHQYFNIGLDLTVFVFISTETKDIPWTQHFLSFPKSDVYSQDKESPYYYFGYLKMPSKWIKPFARKIDRIKKDFGTKCYYKIFTPIDYARYSLSLKETY
jgi:DNA-binding Lrp family transcriptional regulator